MTGLSNNVLPLRQTITVQPADTAAFAPYGWFVTAPDQPGAREFYSDAFDGAPTDKVAVIHVNHVTPVTLPLQVTQVERHAHAAQCFIPLDVDRYLVMVMPSDAAGDPDIAKALCFDMPGNTGVIYAPDVWHMGATVTGRAGHFVVTMWRGGTLPDDEFRAIPPLLLTQQPNLQKVTP